ncbi:MAG: hypothetical protein AAGU11_04645 [Syntrophobacteraceae bacterium]
MMKKEQKLKGVFSAAAAVFVCLWLVCPGISCAGPAKSSVTPHVGSKAKRAPLKQKGSVEKVDPGARKVIIDGVMYYLSEQLVVKNKKGDVLPDYKLSYLSWSHRIEFLSSNYLISEITILKNAS